MNFQFKNVGILDTAVCSKNTGDQIIMDSILHEIKELLEHYRIIYFPTHEALGITSLMLQKCIDINIACGTNLLHSHMGIIKQWRIGLKDIFFLKPIILLGVGWRSKETRKTDIYTKFLLRKILSHNYLHSVRDSYALRQLQKIGFTNVVNTGCPSIWKLTKEHCSQIPVIKGENAILVLTDYSRNDEHDSLLIELVIKTYKNVYFWGQGVEDYNYLKTLGFLDELTPIRPGLHSYDKILSDGSLSLDYVGTRLHGGIRALQYKRRSIIIGVDHRAKIMGSDFNLPVIDRYSPTSLLTDMLDEDLNLSINLPLDNIEKWKLQFRCSGPDSI